MDDLWNGLARGTALVLSFDAYLYEIVLRSLKVTLSAVLIAALIAFPVGAWLAVSRFRGRRTAIAIMNSLMGLPPVTVGLMVYILFSRSGPFGVLELLFTPATMIIAQVIIITPIMASIAHQAIGDLYASYRDLLVSLTATRWQTVMVLIIDARRALLLAGLAGFGRAIGEVGAILIVGGNIDHYTRVLTTAIVLETSKGDFGLALGLGGILILLAVILNIIIHHITSSERTRTWSP